MSQSMTKFVARLPDELHAEIKSAARTNGRSMNSEIIQRLRQPGPEAVTSLTLQVDTKEASAELERLLASLRADTTRSLTAGGVQ